MILADVYGPPVGVFNYCCTLTNVIIKGLWHIYDQISKYYTVGSASNVLVAFRISLNGRWHLLSQLDSVNVGILVSVVLRKIYLGLLTFMTYLQMFVFKMSMLLSLHIKDISTVLLKIAAILPMCKVLSIWLLVAIMHLLVLKYAWPQIVSSSR